MLVKVTDGYNGDNFFKQEINADNFNDLLKAWNDYCDCCEGDWLPIVRVDGKRLTGDELNGRSEIWYIKDLLKK